MPSRPDGSHGNPTGKPWQACSATHPPGLRIRVATACALERQPHRDQRRRRAWGRGHPKGVAESRRALVWPAGAHGSRCRGIVCQCYIGEWRGIHRAHLAGTGQWCFGPPVQRRVLCDVAGDHPGRHADGVPRAPRLCGRNAYRSGVSVCPLLPDPERGQLWVG